MHKFPHGMLPTSFKNLLQKTADVHCIIIQHMQQIKTYFIQVSTNDVKDHFPYKSCGTTLQR